MATCSALASYFWAAADHAGFFSSMTLTLDGGRSTTRQRAAPPRSASADGARRHDSFAHGRRAAGARRSHDGRLAGLMMMLPPYGLDMHIAPRQHDGRSAAGRCRCWGLFCQYYEDDGATLALRAGAGRPSRAAAQSRAGTLDINAMAMEITSRHITVTRADMTHIGLSQKPDAPRAGSWPHITKHRLLLASFSAFNRRSSVDFPSKCH